MLLLVAAVSHLHSVGVLLWGRVVRGVEAVVRNGDAMAGQGRRRRHRTTEKAWEEKADLPHAPRPEGRPLGRAKFMKPALNTP